ncbi:MAG: PadR family transcriptional regulator [Mariniblastus sp.]|nr:PadR family transcriptional regulator [Mariniblastus sp.]
MTARFQRDLLRGSLDLMILSVVSRESQYGYSIQKQLNLATNGQVALPAGTLYPLLHKLESQNLIRSRWDDSTGRRRKWYDITAKGRKALNQRTSVWQNYVACVADLLGDLGGPVIAGQQRNS